MARRQRSPLETRAARERLEIKARPQQWQTIAPGVGLGYARRNGPGRWVLRISNGRGGYAESMLPGVADDYEDSDGEHVRDVYQAQALALQLARGQEGGPTGEARAPTTLNDALVAYAAKLIRLNRSPTNESRLRPHLTATMLATPLELLTGEKITGWIDRLLDDGIGRGNIVRMCKGLKAALYDALDADKRISRERRTDWRKALKPIPLDADEETPPRAIPGNAEVVKLLDAAYRLDPAFGLAIEGLATGTRYSQVARAQIADLHADPEAPHIFMPRSRKGHVDKPRTPYVLPITTSYATKLTRAARGRPATDRLFIMANGEPWKPQNCTLRDLFKIVAAEIGRPDLTPYSLRHWRIISLILGSTLSLQEIAEQLDTSPEIIAKHYAKEIAQRSSEAARRVRAALFDVEAHREPALPKPAKVIPLRG